jgi:hypothetical protein
MTVATLVQAAAALTSFANPIDTLFVLDRQQKDLAAQCKVLKDGIANQYGLSEKDAKGKLIPFAGEKYGVKVTIENRVGSVDVQAVISALGITEDEFNAKFRGESSAIIKVSPCAA